MRYYAVFDTNVLISSLLTKRTDTATAQVVDAVSSLCLHESAMTLCRQQTNKYNVVRMEVFIMATTNLNSRTDKDIKAQADRIFSDRENGIPFALNLDVPNEATAAAIEEGRHRRYLLWN